MPVPERDPALPDLWLCSVLDHGLHDADNPCPDGVEPYRKGERPLCFHRWTYESDQGAYVCVKRCGAARRDK